MKVVVLVDVQNDFIDEALGSPEAQAIVPRVCERVVEIVENSDEPVMIYFTQDTHYDDYLETQEGKKLPVPHCILGTKGWDINQAIYNTVSALKDNNKVEMDTIIKYTFGSDDLGPMLSQLDFETKISEIIFMGLCTDICVVTNCLAAKMYCREIPITVDASCCAGVTPEKHNAALEVMKSCQINVINE